MTAETLDKTSDQAMAGARWFVSDYTRLFQPAVLPSEGYGHETQVRPYASFRSSGLALVPAAPWLKPTIQKMDSLLQLPANWDTYGAPPVDRRYVIGAITLLLDIMENDIPAPSVVPTSKGGLQLEWHTRGIDLEIELLTPSRFEAAFVDSRTGDEWEAVITSDLRKLCEAISALARD